MTVERAGIELYIDSRDAEQGADRVRGALNDLDGTGRQTQGTFDRLGDVLKGVIAIETVRRALNLADNYNVLQQRIRTATKASGDYEKVSKAIFDISQKNGTALKTNVELFQSLARVAPELKATRKEMLTLTDTVGKLGVIGGASTEAMNNGLLQFTQGLAAGTFRAEEFNSILENLPELANRIAGGMNVTTGELRKMVLEGELLSKDVFRVLLKQSEEIKEEFQQMPLTLGRSIETFQNSVSKALGTIDEQINATSTLAGTIETLGSALEGLAENSEVVLTIGGTLAALMGARLVGAIAASTAALTVNTASMVTNAFTARAATTSVSLYTGAITRSAAQMSVAAGAATALRGVMAFLGGPAGVVFLAGSALASYAFSASSAADESDSLNERIKALTQSSKDYRREQLQSAISDVESEMSRLGQTINEMYQNETKYNPIGLLDKQKIDSAKESLLEYHDQLAILKEKLANVNSNEDSAGSNPLSSTNESDSSDDFEKLTEKLLTEEETLNLSYDRRLAMTQENLKGRDEAEQWHTKRLAQRHLEERKLLDRKNKDVEKADAKHQRKTLLGEIIFYKNHSKVLKFFNEWEMKTQQEKSRFIISEAKNRLGAMANYSEKAFKLSKALNLADAVIQGFGAVQKAWNSAPFPANIAAAAFVAAKTAVQIKGIRSQEFKGGGGSFSPAIASGAPTVPTVQLPQLPSTEAFSKDDKKDGGNFGSQIRDDITKEREQPEVREVKVSLNLDDVREQIDPDSLFSGSMVRNIIEKIQDELDDNVNLTVNGRAA